VAPVESTLVASNIATMPPTSMSGSFNLFMVRSPEAMNSARALYFARLSRLTPCGEEIQCWKCGETELQSRLRSCIRLPNIRRRGDKEITLAVEATIDPPGGSVQILGQ
jgi:hypothetical protein